MYYSQLSGHEQNIVSQSHPAAIIVVYVVKYQFRNKKT